MMLRLTLLGALALRGPPARPLARPVARRAAPRLQADGTSAQPATTAEVGETFDSSFSIVREDACVDAFGQSTYGDLSTYDLAAEPLCSAEVEAMLQRILPALPSVPTGEAAPPLDTAEGGREPRGVYCSRTLNMRSIKCIGCASSPPDTLCKYYHVAHWEEAAYSYAKQALHI
ncbi:hypothetical protein T492DRAFT_843861 [Pavlovales sp. CCMP2436]|nr:hypothetical protein T492DRAFT_843861 [Pavlovales sp. CCMP2436]